jgi:hypothetical protein
MREPDWMPARCPCPFCLTVPRRVPVIEGRVLDAQWASEQRRRGRTVQVTIDGEDVTNNCTLAGEGPEGFVYLFRRDERGHLLPCYEPHQGPHICTEMRRGHVRIQPQEET